MEDDTEVDDEAFEAIENEVTEFKYVPGGDPVQSMDSSYIQSSNQKQLEVQRPAVAMQWFTLPAFPHDIAERLSSIETLPQESRADTGKAAMLDIKFVHKIVIALSGKIMSGTTNEHP